MSLMVIGAHAMDAEIMAGGLAAMQAAQGRRVVLLHLTRGERGHPTKPAAEFGRQLEAELAEAAAALGVESRWPGLRAPLRGREAAAAIVQVADEVGAGALVTHWKGSWHPSHRAAHAATLAAREKLARRASVLFAENCEDLAGFAPRWYSDVGPVYEAWLRAMRCYELFRRSEPGSSIEGGIPYWSYYTAAARVRGLEAGCERAEAFRQGPGRAAFSLGLVRAADRRPR